MATLSSSANFTGRKSEPNRSNHIFWGASCLAHLALGLLLLLTAACSSPTPTPAAPPTTVSAASPSRRCSNQLSPLPARA